MNFFTRILFCILGFVFITLCVGRREKEKHSYMEFCHEGQYYKVSPTNETEIVCDKVVHFKFDQGEKIKRVRIYGIFLHLNAADGCAKRLYFGRGQCKDIPIGTALLMLKDGIWHDRSDSTLSVMFQRTRTILEALRLPSPIKEVRSFGGATTFFSIAGDVADMPGTGQKSTYCLTADKVNHTKIVSQRSFWEPGTIQFGGDPDECPYEKYFNSSLHKDAIKFVPEFENCELPCEYDKIEGAGPGPKAISEPDKEKSVEEETERPIVRNRLDRKKESSINIKTSEIDENVVITTPLFIEDNISTTLRPLPADYEENASPVETTGPRKRREIRKHKGDETDKNPITCLKLITGVCRSGHPTLVGGSAQGVNLND